MLLRVVCRPSALQHGFDGVDLRGGERRELGVVEGDVGLAASRIPRQAHARHFAQHALRGLAQALRMGQPGAGIQLIYF